MRSFILSAVLVLGPMALAHQLDNVQGTKIPSTVLENGKRLPQTVIVAIPKHGDKSKVMVAQIQEHLKPGQKAMSAKFEEMSLKAEKSGVIVTAGNEKDVVGSVATDGFGFYGGYRSYRRYVNDGYGYGYGYGGGYRRAPYGYRDYGFNPDSYGYGYPGGCNDFCRGYGFSRAYLPRYSYARVDYGYRPYWGYADDDYDYAYCDWSDWSI